MGEVSLLYRYPVKSMLGEELAHADVTPAGLAGDRKFALIHRATGKVASAKNPRLWRALLTMRAVLPELSGEAARAGDSGGAVRITLADGTVIDSADPGADEMLSKAAGQPVRLACVPPPGAAMEHADPEQVLTRGVAALVEIVDVPLPAATFFNFAAVHLVTTSTLDRIAALSPGETGSLTTAGAPERYRPNIVVRTPQDGFTENDWLGRDLRIGTEVRLRVIARTPRCVVPTLPHGDLPRDQHALRVPAAHNRISAADGMSPQPCAGVYARVIAPGSISVGDAVALI
jgi:uncharacterized protein